MRPGIVHRIDKDTSGLLIVAKNDFAHQALADQLQDHSLSRTYEAIVKGGFKEDEGTVSAPIGRHPVDRKKMAVTDKNSRPAVTRIWWVRPVSRRHSTKVYWPKRSRTFQWVTAGRLFLSVTAIFFRSTGCRPMGASTVPSSSLKPPFTTAS